MTIQGFFSRHELTQVKRPPSLAPRCGLCRLWERCSSPKMSIGGQGRKGILLIGEAPGRNEDAQGKQFVGESGKLLRDRLDAVGIDMDRDCWRTNALICWPWEKDNNGIKQNRTPTNKEIDWCRPNLTRTIKELNPRIIIPLGGAAVRSLVGPLFADNPGPIGRWVGWRIPSQQLNAWICPTWHPSYLLRSEHDAALQLLFREHLRDAVACEGRPWPDGPPDWSKQVERIIDTEEAAKRLRRLLAFHKVKSDTLAWDIETDRIKPDHPDARIVCCSVSNGETTLAFPWHGAARQEMLGLLQGPAAKVGYNCFSGEERILTKEHGLASLRWLVGRTVTVLNVYGNWTEAEIRSFGMQETVETTFSRRNVLTTVRATNGHEWISAEDGGRIRTDALQVRRYGNKTGADRVPYQTAPKQIINQSDYEAGVRHGIVLGDGCKRKNRIGFFQLRLCRGKWGLLRFFDGFTRSYPPSYGGDAMVYVTRQTENLKRVPDASKVSDSYLIGFLRGLLATDGCVNLAGQISITNNKKVLKWCCKYMPRVGYWFQGKVDCSKYGGTEYGPCENIWTVYLSRESVSEDDLLRAAHQRKYKPVSLGPWKFSGFGERRIEEVFCAVVPDGQSFTMANGLVTGNCKFESRWLLAREGIRVRNWVWDGMLAAHTLDNRGGICSLDFQAFTRLGFGDWHSHVGPWLKSKKPGGNSVNRVRELDLDTLLRYCGIDSLVEWKLAQQQRKEMGIET